MGSLSCNEFVKGISGARVGPERRSAISAAVRPGNPRVALAARRRRLEVSARGGAGDGAPESVPPRSRGDTAYFNVTGYPFPLGPLTRRRTIRREIERGSIWVFEQPQSLGFSNVTANVRMTVVKLASGGLWVHAPVAPTAECVRLLKELAAPVEFIVLPTFAYEHKIYVGPFSRRFPKAKVYVAPMQWSWPINLPVQFFGIYPAGVLADGGAGAPWAAEIDQKVLVSSVGIAPYVEVAFFHRRTRTLLVTDAVVSVPERPPPQVAAADLLSAAASNFFIRVLAGDMAEVPVDGVPLRPTELTPAVRDLGWRRMALQILYIVPEDLRDPGASFRAVANRLIVGPILKTLVFTTQPEAARAWVDAICRDWAFRQVIPCHFTAPVKAAPADLKAAFGFLYEGEQKDQRRGGVAGVLGALLGGGAARPAWVRYPEGDVRALDAAKRFLVRVGVVNK